MHRRIIDSPIFHNDGLFKMAFYLIIKASRKTYTLFVGHTKVTLDRGQLITGERALAKELNTKPTTARRRLMVLEKDGFCERKCKHNFSVITIIKYSEYQGEEEKVSANVSTRGAPVETNKNNKNIKNNTSDINPTPESKETLPGKETSSPNPCKNKFLIKKLFKNQYALAGHGTYAGLDGRDFRDLKEIQAVTEDFDLLFRKYFAWYGSNDWWKQKGIKPSIAQLKAKLNDVINYKVETAEDYYKKLAGMR